MRKKSLKDKLLNLILTEGHISYGAICQFIAEEGKKVSTGERRLRELMAESTPYIKSEIKTSRRGTPYIAGYMRTDLEPPKPKQQIVEHLPDGSVRLSYR